MHRFSLSLAMFIDVNTETCEEHYIFKLAHHSQILAAYRIYSWRPLLIALL